MSRRGMFALAAAALAMGTFKASTEPAATTEAAPKSGAFMPLRRRRRVAWRMGTGTSKQTNHLRPHAHTRENARRVRQAARDASRRAARGEAAGR